MKMPNPNPVVLCTKAAPMVNNVSVIIIIELNMQAFWIFFVNQGQNYAGFVVNQGQGDKILRYDNLVNPLNLILALHKYRLLVYMPNYQQLLVSS